MQWGIIIQSRMSSRRLPGKALRLLSGKPLIEHVVERCRMVRQIDHLIVATSVDLSDDPLEAWCKARKVSWFRGDLVDVQGRFMAAATHAGLDMIIRVTGDNPLIAPELIETLADEWRREPVDYLGWRDCVYGTGAELFTMPAFKRAVALSRTPYDHEHVTPPFYEQRQHFVMKGLPAPAGFVCNGLRLSVDTEADAVFVESVINHCGPGYVRIPEVIIAWQQGAIRRECTS